MNEISDSLARAFDRVDDFQAVQHGASPDDLREAVDLLQESVGIRDAERSLLVERLDEIRGAEFAPAHVLLGLILGLMAAQEA